MAKAKIPVGILGATGMVGQRFIQLLEDHPWFEITWLAASERSSGKPYGEAVRWKMRTDLPKRIARIKVSDASPVGAPKIVFAALDADIARTLEPQFAEAGIAVISNSSALRMVADVPLVIPEVNPDHIKLIEAQKSYKKTGGYAVTNANCSTIGLVLALAPLQKAFGIEKLFVATMQAVSGAGYPGVASLDILGNVVPFIKNEEEKMEEEAQKILGKLRGKKIDMASFAVAAHCNRVPVEDGHTESVSIQFKKKATYAQVVEAWRSFRALPEIARLPHAPAVPVFYDERADRPQPRFDVGRGDGMTVSVGRLRPCSILDWKFTLVSHNTIRGAAGAAILNAELLKVKGYIK